MSRIPRRWLLLALCCAGWPGFAGERPALRWASAVPREVAASSPVAFLNVNVVPMDAQRVLERHTVVVRDGRIADLGPAETVEAPADAEPIDAEGFYLMPGLADMHTHFGSDDADWEKDLFLFVANGVTTVREMWGSVRYLRWRDAIAAGDAIGPPGSMWPAPAWTALDVYEAIMAEAGVQGIKVVGHIPSRAGLLNVLAAGQYSIEHLYGFPEPAFSTGSLVTGVLDESRLKELAALIRDAGVWITPTLAVGLVSLDQVPAMLRRPEMRYVSPSLKRWLAHPLQRYPNRDLSLYEANSKLVLKVLEDRGVKLLLGVDSGFRYLLPGFSIHDELRLRVEAGLTPYQALRMATVNAAEFLGAQEHAGAIAVGQRADLILLQASPLEDVWNVNQRVGVMVGGRWLSETRLRETLEEVARSYGN